MMLLLGSGTTTAPPSITTLPTLGSTSYAAVIGTRRMVSGYTGPLYKLFSTTLGAGNELIINQDANGRADESGVAAWAGVNTDIFVDGAYDQVSGAYIQQATALRKPRYRTVNKENGNSVFSMGWNATGALSLNQIINTPTISTNQNNAGMFLVMRPLGGGLGVRLATYETAVPAVALRMGIQTYGQAVTGNTNNTSFVSPPVNRLSIMSIVSNSTNLRFWMNDRQTTAAAQTSSALVKATMGREEPTSSFSSLGEYAGLVITAAAPNDTDRSAIHAALETMFGIVKTRNNVMCVLPHSLAFNANLGVYNRTVWKQADSSFTSPVEIVQVGVSGRTMAAQATSSSEVTNLYESGAGRYIYYMGCAVNDIQALASGFANGNASLITSAVAGIYTTYKNFFTTLKAQGSNVRIVIATCWQPNSTFWSGTAQDKLDKAAALTEFNALLRTNSTVDDFSVSDEETISTSGSPFGDAVHTNEVGEGYRVAPLIAAVNPLLV